MRELELVAPGANKEHPCEHLSHFGALQATRQRLPNAGHHRVVLGSRLVLGLVVVLGVDHDEQRRYRHGHTGVPWRISVYLGGGHRACEQRDVSLVALEWDYFDAEVPGIRGDLAKDAFCYQRLGLSLHGENKRRAVAESERLQGVPAFRRGHADALISRCDDPGSWREQGTLQIDVVRRVHMAGNHLSGDAEIVRNQRIKAQAAPRARVRESDDPVPFS
ncbi:MAG: hypothetical protein F4121_10780 [Acidimicrobiia bacterium]|nr:hypothetical protein [Acidimicrobiia bacterium]